MERDYRGTGQDQALTGGFRACVRSPSDQRPDDMRLSDLERMLGLRQARADVRPDFNWKGKPCRMMGYR